MSSSTQIQVERRRTPRCAFGGVAEVTAPKLGKYLVAITSEIGLLGCFVKTATPFPSGEPVNLKITYDGTVFAVQGEVVYVLSTKGMGIRFSAVPPRDQAILKRWLAAPNYL